MDTAADPQNTCSICLDRLDDVTSTQHAGGVCAVNDCGHVFHTTCVNQWLALTTDQSCPFCKTPAKGLLRLFGVAKLCGAESVSAAATTSTGMRRGRAAAASSTATAQSAAIPLPPIAQPLFGEDGFFHDESESDADSWDNVGEDGQIEVLNDVIQGLEDDAVTLVNEIESLKREATRMRQSNATTVASLKAAELARDRALADLNTMRKDLQRSLQHGEECDLKIVDLKEALRRCREAEAVRELERHVVNAERAMRSGGSAVVDERGGKPEPESVADWRRENLVLIGRLREVEERTRKHREQEKEWREDRVQIQKQRATYTASALRKDREIAKLTERVKEFEANSKKKQTMASRIGDDVGGDSAHVKENLTALRGDVLASGISWSSSSASKSSTSTSLSSSSAFAMKRYAHTNTAHMRSPRDTRPPLTSAQLVDFGSLFNGTGGRKRKTVTEKLAESRIQKR